MTKSTKKRSSPHYKANNKGGYGNPPVKSQFKKGGPGGPGRKPGSRTFDGALKKVFGGKIPKSDGGAVATVDAVAQRTRAYVLQSPSIAAIRLGMELAEKYGPQEPEKPQADMRVDRLNEPEFELFSLLLNIVAGKPPLKSEQQEGELSKMLGTYMVFERASGVLGVEKISGRHRFTREETLPIYTK